MIKVEKQMSTNSTPLPSPPHSDAELMFAEATRSFKAPLPRAEHERLLEQKLIEDAGCLTLRVRTGRTI